jgi:negative regulator of flagellin synthesis FlgM
MFDPIGAKAGSAINDLRSRAVAPVDGAAKSKAIASPEPQAPATSPVQAGEVARALAAEPPVDAERVQIIKRALAEGRFPIYPAEIADRLIAFQLGWAKK